VDDDSVVVVAVAVVAAAVVGDGFDLLVEVPGLWDSVRNVGEEESALACHLLLGDDEFLMSVVHP